MSEFGWQLQSPVGHVTEQSWEDFVSDYVDWEDDYSSQVTLACDYLELCGYTFNVHGFGHAKWPVTVGYDLSTVLEDMPNQLTALASGQPAKIDMYAPGTEVELDAIPQNGEVILKCTTALWVPHPETLVVPRTSFAETVRQLLADFSNALRNVGASLANNEPFVSWGQTPPNSPAPD